MSADDAARTWDERDIALVRSVAWNTTPGVGQWVSDHFCGSPDLNWALLAHDLLQARVPHNSAASLRGIAIACGDMASERDVFEHRSTVQFTHVDGYDVSAESLARYDPGARRHDLSFTPHVVDVNTFSLAEGLYDFAIGSHGLHHIEDLDNAFAQLHRSLLPHGLLHVYEWIGPEYLQLPRRNRIVAVVLLSLLFPRRASRTTHEGHVKGRRWLGHRPDELDPSEACNSTRLMPELLARFDPIRRYDHGGVLYPVLEGLAHRVDPQRRADRWRVRVLCVLDGLLCRSRIVKPLFTVAISARK